MAAPDGVSPDSGGVVPFRLWPPIAMGIPLVAAALVTWLAGDPFMLGGWRVPLGWGLVALFVLWNGWALVLFQRHRTGLLPGQATRTIMTSGPFAVSRNPLYVGMLALYVGLALLIPSTWALLATPIAAGLVLWGAILPEEKFLSQEFGSEYDDYARRVRRWL
ncbi:MAG: isoprenylcysteine carboxylmethyltransferase family protein [Knoellia sp.]